jgi:predicted RND superfamily exporter protein
MSGTGFGAVLGVVYILLAVLYFFPCLYLLRFSNHMKVALATEDQTRLTTAFENLKSVFKFIGVLTIVILGIYVLAFLFGGLAAAFG